MDWWMLLLAFIAGGIATFLIITILVMKTDDQKTDGELQVYKNADGLYPVLALNSEQCMTNKSRVILEVKFIDTESRESHVS